MCFLPSSSFLEFTTMTVLLEGVPFYWLDSVCVPIDPLSSRFELSGLDVNLRCISPWMSSLNTGVWSTRLSSSFSYSSCSIAFIKLSIFSSWQLTYFSNSKHLKSFIWIILILVSISWLRFWTSLYISIIFSLSLCSFSWNCLLFYKTVLSMLSLSCLSSFFSSDIYWESC